jgi:signal transduction histidine kinase
MLSLRRSIATRLALGYGLLVAASITILAVVFYLGTLIAFDRSINGKIITITSRLIDAYEQQPREELAGEIRRLLADGIDSDTEIYLVTDAAGARIAGNISTWPRSTDAHGRLIDAEVMREGRKSPGRLFISPLPGGGILVVGRDLADRAAIRDMVWRALAIGAALSLVLIAGGAVFFRRQIEARIGDIRHTAREIEAGDLSQRIPIPRGEDASDEFGRLKADINRMLDRIQHLVEGVRHVSNAIAHDLRTPLARVRSQLEGALQGQPTVATLSSAGTSAIAEIDGLITLFEKLLQIAEAESGMRPESFDAIDLRRIAEDMVELSNATSDDRRVDLSAMNDADVPASGDRNLIASAVAGLIDNAVKYAGPAARIEVGAFAARDTVGIVVRDDGPGIPEDELPNVTGRFYRLDRSRHLPGNGLGLSIASAIATLHRGRLTLANGAPGLIARIELPRREGSAGAALVAAVRAGPR